MATDLRTNANLTPKTVDELTQHNIETILKLESATKAERSRTQYFAETVTKFCGSMGFIWAHIGLIALWMLWNSREMSAVTHFDPFPFNFLACVFGCEAIFLAAFILMNQRHEAQLSERRNHLDLQINLLSEQENTKMLKMLSQIAKAVGADLENDASLNALEAATRPDKMLQQIDQTIAQHDADENTRKPKNT